MTCIRTPGWNRAFELHRLMKKIHRSIMDKLSVVLVCAHTSNCSNPKKTKSNTNIVTIETKIGEIHFL